MGGWFVHRVQNLSINFGALEPYGEVNNVVRILWKKVDLEGDA
jgi:hypothetical protein